MNSSDVVYIQEVDEWLTAAIASDPHGVVVDGRLVARRFTEVDACNLAACERRGGHTAVVIRLPAEFV